MTKPVGSCEPIQAPTSSTQTLALITGASSGIGLEFAFQIASNSNEAIALVARRKDRLEELKKEILKRHPEKKVFCLSYDLSLQDQRDQMWKEVEGLKCNITTLINNAGFGSFGRFSDMKIQNELQMIDLNIKAVVDLTHKVLGGMIKRNNGQILNVSSMASFQALPYITTYAATKAFVTNFSLALGQEVAQYGIKVQALCPGPVPTEFGEVAGFPSQISFTNSISAKIVAEKGLRGLENNKALIIPGVQNWLLAQVNRFIPRPLAARIAFLVLRSKFD